MLFTLDLLFVPNVESIRIIDSSESTICRISGNAIDRGEEPPFRLIECKL